MNREPTVFVVDDDARARASVCALVRSMGLPTLSFASAEEFLEYYKNDYPGCLVTDFRMAGMNGLRLLERLKELGILLPVILLTAYAHTSLTVRAIRDGAVTLLDKPYPDDELWDAIRTALSLNARRRSNQQRRQHVVNRARSLTDSERKVMDMIVDGKANKVIARRLDVSVRTVENRRREVYEKMQAESVAQLVQMVIEAGI